MKPLRNIGIVFALTMMVTVSAIAQVPDDNLIVPGERISAVSLGIGVNEGIAAAITVFGGSLSKAKDCTRAEDRDALGLIQQLHDWDWAGAEREYERTIQLNPNYAVGYMDYADFLYAMGRFDQAIGAAKKAVEVDPLSLMAIWTLGRAFYFARQYDRTIDLCRKVLEMDPNYERAHYWLGLTYLQKKMFKEAENGFEKAKQLELSSGRNGASGDQGLALVYATSGKRSEALKLLHELEKEHWSYGVAEVYGAFGDKDRAFERLEKAYQDRAFQLTRLKVEPKLDPLRSDPRFADLVRRMGLPP